MDVLQVESLIAEELADRFGTPLYVISERSIRQRFRASQAAARAVYPTAEIYYAVKANPILAVRRILAQEGAGGDAFSLAEVEISLRAGVPGDKLVMIGQAKGEALLEAAVRHGITVTLDNPGELELLQQVAERLGRPARAFVRLKIDLESVARELPGEEQKIRDRVLRTRVGLHAGGGGRGREHGPGGRLHRPAWLPSSHRVLRERPRLPRGVDEGRSGHRRPAARAHRAHAAGA